MKTNHLLQTAGLALAFLSTLSPQLSTCLAQGSLTPPGAPAPTMKTLDQIEPRTPISAAPFTIANSGAYYLTTNLTVSGGHAITIATNGVSLDLNGFTIASTAASANGNGILLNGGLRDMVVANGHITSGVTNNAGVYNGPGFQAGIWYSNTAPMNTRVSGVSVSGCLTHGIYLHHTSGATLVDSCTVQTVGGVGIRASTITSSVALDCGGNAIYGFQVSDCRGESTASGNGVQASTANNCSGASSGGSGVNASVANNCFGSSSTGTGLVASVAQNCSGSSGGSGIGLRADDVATGCRGSSATGIGVQAYIANSCRVGGGTTNITYKYNMP